MDALLKHGVRLGDIKSVDEPVILGRAEMEKAWLSLTDGQREMLQRTRYARTHAHWCWGCGCVPVSHAAATKCRDNHRPPNQFLTPHMKTKIPQ